MRIRTQCRACGLPFQAILEPGAVLECPSCGESRSVAAGGWAASAVERCPLCGCEHLYRQRDINRTLGCALVAVGAVLVPWTWGLSLVVLALVDLWLYYRLAPSVVCYRCDTVFRDARPGPRQGDFELLKHDVLKYGKSWKELELEEGPTSPPTAEPGPPRPRPPAAPPRDRSAPR